MIVFSVRAQVEHIKRSVGMVVSRQIPFATATALTSLARLIKTAEQKNEAERLDRPRPFTQSAIRVVGARKDTLTARVHMLDLTAAYMDPYEFGGRNKLNAASLFKPVEAKKDLDRFGNLPRNYTKSLARSDVFVGKVKTKIGEVDGIWQRSTEQSVRRVSVLRIGKDGKPRIAKTGKNLNKSGKLKLLVKFTDAHPIDEKNRLHWFDVAEDVVKRNFKREFSAAMRNALKTARP